MIKFFKALFLICVLAINCSACGIEDYETGYAEGYDEGLSRGIGIGQREVFENLWRSANLNNVLTSGFQWETEHFSFVITDEEKNTTNSLDKKAEPTVEFELTLKDGTIADYHNGNEIFFNIYSSNGDNWEPVLYNDDYYMFASLTGRLDGNTCSAEIGLYDDTKRLGIIIVIDGSIYKATYELL